MKAPSKVGWVVIILVLLIAARVAHLTWQRSLIPNLRAATVPTQPLVQLQVDFIQQFPEKFPLQVAVLWVNSDDAPLSLVHAFRQMGIPFFITRDFDQALTHRQVVIFPSVDGKTFTEAQAQQLTQYVEKGGVLFAQNVFWGVLKPLFGFYKVFSSQKRQRVNFAVKQDPIFKYLDRPEEKELQLKGEKVEQAFWTNGYTSDQTSEVLASFEDGTAALLSKTLGAGKVYLCGIGLDEVIIRNQTNRDFDAYRQYVNGFEPGTDVWLLLLRAWYETSTTDWVRVATIPNGQRSALLLSHNVDWERAVRGAPQFAAMEKRNGATSTFFIQTKYVSDGTSWAFFLGENLDIIRQLKAEGFDLGSHAVIHPHVFQEFPLGTGEETFASYRPYARSARQGLGATLFGEVRVSKELLDGEIPDQHTIFFRAAHLQVPQTLPEVLQRCGYEFDSSFTSGEILSNFPYSLPLDLGFVQDSAIYELPIVIEAEAASELASRIDGAIEVIRANADNGAPSVCLIPTDNPQQNVPAEENLLHRLPKDIGVSEMSSFARFWRARDRLQWRVEATEDPQVVVLGLTADEAVTGLTFEFARKIEEGTGGANLLADKQRLILPELQPGQELTLHVKYAP